MIHFFDFLVVCPHHPYIRTEIQDARLNDGTVFPVLKFSIPNSPNEDQFFVKDLHTDLEFSVYFGLPASVKLFQQNTKSSSSQKNDAQSVPLLEIVTPVPQRLSVSVSFDLKATFSQFFKFYGLLLLPTSSLLAVILVVLWSRSTSGISC